MAISEKKSYPYPVKGG